MFPISVKKNDRNESGKQFLDTALKLRVYTLQNVIKLPKRYTFLTAQKLSDMSAYILDNIKFGNSLHPVNAIEVQDRRNAFIHARARLYSMVSEIEAVSEACGLPSTTMREWMALIELEIRLLSGIIKKDRETYKDLTE